MKNLGVPNANTCTNFDVKSGLSLKNHFLTARDIESLHGNSHTRNTALNPHYVYLSLRQNKMSTFQVK